MRKALLALPLLFLVGVIGWLLRAPTSTAREPIVSAEATPAVPSVSAKPMMGGVPVAATPGAPEPTLMPKKLDPKSEALRVRVDEQIPTRLYAEAAKCYKGGLSRDERMDLTFRLRVADGEVSISNVKVDDSTMTDRSLERCIQDRVSAAKWRDEEMPDWESDEETLYLSVRGFKQYLASADDDAPSGTMN